MKYETYLLLGAPGSGKGTQGRVLGTVPRFFHMACGDVFRSLDTRTPLGQEFLKYSSKGQLVPDELTVQLWLARLNAEISANHYKPDIDCLVLDGIPRDIGQARIMQDLVHVRRVFHLSCPDRGKLAMRLKKRALKDNRLDDASDVVIERRLATYDAETRPLLDFYSEDLVVRIDATQPPVFVLRDIIDEMAKDRHAAI